MIGRRFRRPFRVVELGGRTLEVYASRAARSALADLSLPLAIDLEVLFSCFIRKRVRFTERAPSDAAAAASLGPKAVVRFRPVQGRACTAVHETYPGELEPLPIVCMAPFVPRWLTLEYRGGRWYGDCGF